jgi:iron complex transport system ATP-binding protein
VLVARALMAAPGLVLLDEPGAGLDLGARERLVADLGSLAADDATVPIVLVTHHLEEVPVAFTHALVLRDGRVLSAGVLEEVLTADVLGEAFEVPLTVRSWQGRWTATAG